MKDTGLLPIVNSNYGLIRGAVMPAMSAMQTLGWCHFTKESSPSTFTAAEFHVE